MNKILVFIRQVFWNKRVKTFLPLSIFIMFVVGYGIIDRLGKPRMVDYKPIYDSIYTSIWYNNVGDKFYFIPYSIEGIIVVLLVFVLLVIVLLTIVGLPNFNVEEQNIKRYKY